jgi:hypothetical protein
MDCCFCEIQTAVSLENDRQQEQSLAAHNAAIIPLLNNLTQWGELMQEL